jgi:Flp pilus assembly protein TadD
VDYRRGIALQELGRKDEARAAYTRFVAAGKGQKAALEDARKRLAELGG